MDSARSARRTLGLFVSAGFLAGIIAACGSPSATPSLAASAGMSVSPSRPPTIAFGPLPAATALPTEFPVNLVPNGGRLVDAASVAGKDFAIFWTSDPVASLMATYQAALGGYAQDLKVTTIGPSSTIDFTVRGKPGLVALSAATGGGTTVSIEVTP